MLPFMQFSDRAEWFVRELGGTPGRRSDERCAAGDRIELDQGAPDHGRGTTVDVADELLPGSRARQEAGRLTRDERLRTRVAFARPRKRLQSQPSGGLRLILVVDDDPASRKFLRVLLEAEGYIVRAVTDAELGLLAAAESAPSLVVTDLFLPGMSGVSFIRCLKEDPATRGIPIVVVTVADAEDDITRQALAEGAEVCCVKPLSRESFVRVVESVLAAREGSGAPDDSTDEG
jgi:CheY-like chemotaxis protein